MGVILIMSWNHQHQRFDMNTVNATELYTSRGLTNTNRHPQLQHYQKGSTKHAYKHYSLDTFYIWFLIEHAQFGGFPIPLNAGIFNNDGLGSTKQPPSPQKEINRFVRGEVCACIWWDPMANRSHPLSSNCKKAYLSLWWHIRTSSKMALRQAIKKTQQTHNFNGLPFLRLLFFTLLKSSTRFKVRGIFIIPEGLFVVQPKVTM